MSKRTDLPGDMCSGLFRNEPVVQGNQRAVFKAVSFSEMDREGGRRCRLGFGAASAAIFMVFFYDLKISRTNLDQKLKINKNKEFSTSY